MIAALYDIHGNLPALEAVLEAIQREDIDQIVVGGDVFPGPMAREALERLLHLDIPVRFIHGNGDRETIALKRGMQSNIPEMNREAMLWGAEQLSPEHEQLMAAWPGTLQVITEERRILFCHATPQNDTDIFTHRTPEERLRPWFTSVDADLVVCGHTHMQFGRPVGRVRVVNAGSVGMPFGSPGAYWLVIGASVEFRLTSYDLARAAERIRASGYPRAEQFAATNILNPPSEEQMLEVFERTWSSEQPN